MKFNIKFLLFFLVIIFFTIFFYSKISIKNDKVFARKKSLALVQTTSYKDHVYINHFIKNKIEYTNLSGYSLIVDEPLNKERNPKWSKLLSVLKAFNSGYEWVWLLDLDTIITNFNIKIHHLTNLANLNNYDILITKDCQSINTGSILFKNSNYSRYFLNTLWNSYGNEIDKTDEWCEQRAFISFYHKLKEAKNHILLIPQKSINAYPVENVQCQTDEKGWKEGDFIVHFAGIHNDNLYNKYLNIFKDLKSKKNLIDTNKWLNYIKDWVISKYNIKLIN